MFLAGAIAVNFYVLGYRIDSDLKITKTGGIYIYSPEAKSDIYLNNRLKEQTGIILGGVFIQNLKPQKYSVLVAKNGYWPWQKNITIKEEVVAELRAMVISQNTKGEIILKGLFLNLYSSPEQKVAALVERKNNGGISKKLIFYLPEEKIFLTPDSSGSQNLIVFKNISRIEWSENAMFFSTEKGLIRAGFNLKNKTFRAEKTDGLNSNKDFLTEFASSELENFKPNFAKISSRKKEIIWQDGQNTIWFDILKDENTLPYFLFGEKNLKFPVVVFHSKFPLANIDFFPGRSDAAVIALNNGVYGLEFDSRGGRNLQPIYKGKSPDFAVFRGDKKIYVLDDGNFISIEL